MGELLEENFMQAMIAADGNILAFFGRPIAATLGLTTILVWFSPLIRLVIAKLRQRSSRTVELSQNKTSCKT
jgi:TctA family transporter